MSNDSFPKSPKGTALMPAQPVIPAAPYPQQNPPTDYGQPPYAPSQQAYGQPQPPYGQSQQQGYAQPPYAQPEPYVHPQPYAQDYSGYGQPPPYPQGPVQGHSPQAPSAPYGQGDPQQAYAPQAYPQQAYPQQPQQAYPQQAYPQQAYPQQPQQAYPQQAYPQEPQQAYPQQAYPQQAYPQQAYPQAPAHAAHPYREHAGSDLLPCPDCGQGSDSLKKYTYLNWIVFLFVFYYMQRRTKIACPPCMRKEVLKRTAINIVTCHILWPVVVLPWHLVVICMSYRKGHSNGVKALIAGQPAQP